MGGLEDLTESSTISLGDGLAGTTFPISFPRAKEPGRAPWSSSGRRSRTEPGTDKVLASLASQAILAYELANVRSERDVLLISADRERIARDLHDLVIQRLFGAGLRLQGALALIDNETVSTRVSSTIEDLDTTIKEIREAIFALEQRPVPGCGPGCWKRWRTPLRRWVSGPPFRSTAPANARCLTGAARGGSGVEEALSNAARHAHANRVEVHITVDDELGILVVDNGVGIGDPSPERDRQRSDPGRTPWRPSGAHHSSGRRNPVRMAGPRRHQDQRPHLARGSSAVRFWAKRAVVVTFGPPTPRLRGILGT